MNEEALRKALVAFRKGDFVIVIDDEKRENEGDLVLAAQDITPAKVNFMLTYGKGLICVPMSAQRAKKLGLKRMVSKNEEFTKCAFTVSVDAKGTGSGISATARAKTIKKLSNDSSKASDFVRPGHVFPLIGAKGGLRKRQGHTEASLELCKRAGKRDVAVICEVLDSKGEVMRGKSLWEFAKENVLPVINIKELL